MAPPKYTPNYWGFTIADLHNFINQRKLSGGITDLVPYYTPHHTCSVSSLRLRDKVVAINILEQADRDFRFRFADLPGELQNRIYNNLLLFTEYKEQFSPDAPIKCKRINEDAKSTVSLSKDNWKCFPQILATCKWINKDATSILYAGNTPKITLCRRSVFLFGRLLFEICQNVAYRLTSAEDCWPAVILKATDVHLSLHGFQYEGQIWKDCLYSLCRFLLRSDSKVKSVTIIDGHYDDPWLPRRLTGERRYFVDVINTQGFKKMKDMYPLARLVANLDCQFRSFSSEATTALNTKASEHADLFKIDIPQRAKIIGKQLSCDEYLQEMIPYRLPRLCADYQDLRKRFMSAYKDEHSELEKWEVGINKLMDDIDALLEHDGVMAIMEEDMSEEDGFVLSEAQEFWQYDRERRQMNGK